MPGSAADPVRLSPFRRIVSVTWPKQTVDLHGIGIISTWSEDPADTQPWRMFSRLNLPGFERWTVNESYYVGLHNSPGLGFHDDPYPGSRPPSYWKTDPDDSATTSMPDDLILPEQGQMADYYLWSVGVNRLGTSQPYATCIVNIDKIVADFSSSDAVIEMIRLSIAGLGDGFHVLWDFRVFEGQDSNGPGFFSFSGDRGRVDYSMPQIDIISGRIEAQIIQQTEFGYPS